MKEKLVYLFVALNVFLILIASTIPSAALLYFYYYKFYLLNKTFLGFLGFIPLLWVGIYLTAFLNIALPVVLRKALYRFKLKQGTISRQSIDYYKWLIVNGLYSYAMVWRLMLPFLDVLTCFICEGFGAKIGKNVTALRVVVLDPWFLEIGNNVMIGHDAFISAHFFEKNELICGSVSIGDNCTIGSRAIVSPGVQIGKNSIIGANSFVKKNQVVPENSKYAGVPAHTIV